MKIKKIIAVILASVMLCLGLVIPAFAASSDNTTYYEQQVQKFEDMKASVINTKLQFHGMYVTKESKLYGREVLGVDSNGNFVLSKWQLLDHRTNVPYSTKEFTIPGTFVAFAYSFDITWGTDWPYSGIFWNDPNTKVNNLTITTCETCRDATIAIEVNNLCVYLGSHLGKHTEWKP